MPTQLSLPRSLAVAATAVGAAALIAATASATTGSKTANGFTVTASLSPDSVSTGQIVSTGESVTNVTASPVSATLTTSLHGPGVNRTSTILLMLKPSQTRSQSRRFTVPASAAAGAYTLTITATNQQGGLAQTSAATRVG